jgi:hypothetical protein
MFLKDRMGMISKETVMTYFKITKKCPVSGGEISGIQIYRIITSSNL